MTFADSLQALRERMLDVIKKYPDLYHALERKDKKAFIHAFTLLMKDKLFTKTMPIDEIVAGTDLAKRRTLLFLRNGLVAGAAATLLLNPTEALAQQGITVHEYYRKAKPADQIMKGVRVGEYAVPLTSMNNSFLNGIWNKYYFSDGQEGKKIKEILSRDHQIDFGAFDLFYRKHGMEYKAVVIHLDGYLRFDKYDRSDKLIFPISSKTVEELRKLPGVS